MGFTRRNLHRVEQFLGGSAHEHDDFIDGRDSTFGISRGNLQSRSTGGTERVFVDFVTRALR